MSYDPQRFPQLLASLNRVVGELGKMFPSLCFTPEGRMVDSLGTAITAFHYGITLHQDPGMSHDGTVGSRQVQIRTTQGDVISISSEPDYLIALRMNRDGTFEECFNGPGAVVWSLVAGKTAPKSGQRQIRLSKLRAAMKAAKFTPEQSISRVNHVDTFRRWLA